MTRAPAPNPMDRRPPPCACGAPAARAEIVTPRCHLCRLIAGEHPKWSPAQVAAAGAHRWTVLALRGVRALARMAPGEPREDAVHPGRFVWVVKEGYERLTIREGEKDARAALAEAWPDLVVAARHEADGAALLKLVERGAASAEEVAA